MTKNIISELKILVFEALNDTTDRLQNYPNYGPYIHAKNQLLIIKNNIENQKIVNDEDKKEINIGIMAVKELDAEEPEYAKLLMKISTKYKSL